MIAEDMNQQLIAKLIEASCFALQFDETTDITNHAQLIVYCRFPSKSVGKLFNIFCCFPIGLQTTEEFIFFKLVEFFQHENLSRDKCVAVITDGAAAMIGKLKGTTALIKHRSPICKFLHCILHRKALDCKKLKANSSDEMSELEKLMSDVMKIFNVIRLKAKSS